MKQCQRFGFGTRESTFNLTNCCTLFEGFGVIITGRGRFRFGREGACDPCDLCYMRQGFSRLGRRCRTSRTGIWFAKRGLSPSIFASAACESNHIVVYPYDTPCLFARGPTHLGSRFKWDDPAVLFEERQGNDSSIRLIL